VQSRNTIVLGGLVKRKTSKIDRGIPILYKIPLIGWIFGYSSDESTRGEIIVFITPYVLNTPEEIEAEASRRQKATETQGLWQKGWSESRLAEGPAMETKPAVKPPEAATPSPVPPPAMKPPVSEPVVPEPATPATATPEPPAAKPADVDPAVLKFLEEQNRKYGAAEEDADRKMEKELEEAGIPAVKKP
jgi:Flp pilus assembly secretin CpaC